ncbi:ASC-1-like (ASCH) protein [Lactobacillus colini]|uniref:ASC-1-like (ASCH) protein n=1 Tax=Lactobacillus colini TaxID=1819254 RepID=A0ABS4MH11_9LACO|nr:ASCH domain-containing protein [Lactobacillus colini]MBP2058607.1 ASC-1-like (ASCH) protein [Lactobacillus colini]
MKALSIRGDYIRDIIEGRKTIEYRTWQTKYRGPVLLCSTTKKVDGGLPGYAIAVANLTDINWNGFNECYYWHLAPFEKGGSYLIEPIKVKGQLRLFNVTDELIKPAPFIKVDHDNPKFEKWWQNKVEPLVYHSKKRRKATTFRKFRIR